MTDPSLAPTITESNFFALLTAGGMAVLATPVVLHHVGYGWPKVALGTVVGVIIALFLAGFVNRWVAAPLGLPVVWLVPVAYGAALVWGWTHAHLLDGTERPLPPEED